MAGSLAAGGAAGAAPAGAAGDERAAAPVDTQLAATLDAKGSADLWVVLEADADLRAAAAVADWTQRGAAVVAALQATAESSQKEVRETLSAAGADFTPFWASNQVLVRGADQAMTARLAAVDGVERLTATQTMEIPEKVEPGGGNAVQAVEWGIDAINADDVWDQFGVRGEGLVVANIDSGVQYDHPALVSTYRGNEGGTFEHDHNWFDPSLTCGPATAAPCDNNGHGTHTMGTMVGEAGANQIGVAPAARWIAAKGCETNGCSDASLLASGQWILAPTDTAGNDPRPDLRPHVVNNSWGEPNGPVVNPWYDDIVTAWTASGIFGVFSNGNEGPSCDTTGSPADSVHAFGVGGFQSDGAVYGSSSRGPGQPGVIRPNISAPAVNVRSSLPDSTYGTATGTSMAAPHVSGTVALIWAAAPALVGNINGTRELLAQTAIDTDDTTCGGTPENNNTWGEGKLDALAVVTAAPRGDTGTLVGTVTDGATGEPVEGADVTVTGTADRSTSTGADGRYSLVLPVGDYTVTASRFGYADGSATATVFEDDITAADVVLEPVPAHSLSGTVTDSRGRPVEGATVTLLGTPLPPATTGADGRYSFEAVPEGTYQLLATASSCSDSLTREVVVDGDEVVDLSLPDRVDGYGYSCAPEDSEYVEGTTPLALTGDDATAPFDLPFPFTFYGQTYEQAHVATNGHLNFLAPSTAFSNSALPNPAAPNAAVYPLWDDLQVDAEAQVLTATGGEAPNRWVVVEWRNVRFFGGTTPLRVDTEAVLHENGDVVTAWRGIDPDQPREAGSSATVGIEDESGTVALEYSFNTPRLSDDTAVRFSLPPNAYVTGTVTDANDGLPVAGAVVRALQDGTEVRTATTGADGTYRMQLWLGTYTITAEAARYGTASQEVVLDTEQEVVTADFALATPRGEVTPDALRWVLPEGVQRRATLTLANTGSGTLHYEVAELGGQPRANVEAKVTGTAARGVQATTAKDARALFSDAAAAAAVPLAPGDVLASWPATGASTAWGVGYSGDVWISDPDTKRNLEYDTTGTPTGRVWPADWAGTWNADLAQDTRSGTMCQVNVGGDNGIHCWDEATGDVQYSLTGAPWSSVSQRGLAYRADDDTFYVGGWNENVVYHVAGASHPAPGALLGQCASPAGLAGLAFNATSGTLWATTNSVTNTVYQLAPDDCTVVSTLGFPETAQFAGAGLDLDPTGNLWMTSQVSGTVYLVDSGVPQASDVPWLQVAPTSGEVAAGASTELTVSVDTTGLAAGVYDAQILITTDAGRQPRLTVPVELVVSGYWQGVNAGGGAYTDTSGITWAADQEHAAGSFGWTGRSTVAAERNAEIAGTQDDPLYRDQRQGMDAYVFDDLPAGTYEVTLDFAELLTNPRTDWRMFDVRVDGDWALVGYDIAAEVGGRTADRRTVLAEVAEDGGSLQIEFLDRRGYRPSVVNAVQVVHRPDL